MQTSIASMQTLQTWFGRLEILLLFLVVTCVWFIFSFGDLFTVNDIGSFKPVQDGGVRVSDNKTVQYRLEDNQADESWENQQELRKRHIRKVCEKYPDLKKIVSVRSMFIYDANTNLAYCRHGKVGTTTWLGHFLSLSNITEPQFSNISTSVDLLHVMVPEMFRVKGREEELETFISGTVSFSMVRHPLERLVSAYEDKIIKPNSFYKNLKNVIEALFGEVTFTTFVKYILMEFARGDVGDVHWRPYVSRCNYCNVNYTVIAKLETFEADLAHISSLAGVQFSSNHGNQGGETDSLTTRHFRQLPRSLGEQLYRVYEKDFLMFDYDPGKYLNLTMPVERSSVRHGGRIKK